MNLFVEMKQARKGSQIFAFRPGTLLKGIDCGNGLLGPENDNTIGMLTSPASQTTTAPRSVWAVDCTGPLPFFFFHTSYAL